MANFNIKVNEKYGGVYLHPFDTLKPSTDGIFIPEGMIARLIIDWFDANKTLADRIHITQNGKKKLTIVKSELLQEVAV